MPEYNNDSFAAIAQLSQAMADEFSADLLPLMAWQNRHRRQRNSRDGSAFRFDTHSTEQNVGDNLPVELRDKRQQDGSLGAQVVDKTGFVGAAESGLVHHADLHALARQFVSNE